MMPFRKFLYFDPCMHLVHGFACAEVAHSGLAPPELAQIRLDHAAALKSPHKAGRRGGDSTARQTW